MDVMSGFLRSEINSQELYETILQFVLSPHIRNGEFEGNEYIIKKNGSDKLLCLPRIRISRWA